MPRSKKKGPSQGPIINEVLCWTQNVINVYDELNFLNQGSEGFSSELYNRNQEPENLAKKIELQIVN